MKKHMTRNIILMLVLDVILGIVLALYIANTGTVPAADNAGWQGGRDAVGLPAGGWLDRRSGCCLRQHHDQRRGICGNERLPCTGRTVMKF